MNIRLSKIVSMVMALALLISLCACGNQNSGQILGTETTSAETAADTAESDGVSSDSEVTYMQLLRCF